MAVTETIAGGVVGGLTGALTAYLTARGKVNAVRAEFEGELQKLGLTRTHELEDRAAEAQASEHAAAAERARALRAAATSVASALRHPDSMRHNLNLARKEVNNATAAIEEKGELADLAERLRQASQHGDASEVESVVRDLRHVASRSAESAREPD